MTRRASPDRGKKFRLTLALNPQDAEAIDWLRNNTNHTTMTEVIATSIRLYRLILENKYNVITPSGSKVILITSGGFLG